MQRQRGELVPIGDALADLDGPVKTLREASPQALHHFTQADQVNQLVSASEADANLGFMARQMALCSLPRTNPGHHKEYKRVNGPYTLYMVAGGGNKLPYGNFPRLILAWVSTEAVRTQSRSILLTSNLVFSDWERIFKDPLTTAAAIDRLVHHSVILELNVTSYRMEAANSGSLTIWPGLKAIY